MLVVSSEELAENTTSTLNRTMIGMPKLRNGLGLNTLYGASHGQMKTGPAPSSALA